MTRGRLCGAALLLLGGAGAACGGEKVDEPAPVEDVVNDVPADDASDDEDTTTEREPTEPVEAPPSVLVTEELPLQTLRGGLGADVPVVVPDTAQSVTLVVGGVEERILWVRTITDPTGEVIYRYGEPGPAKVGWDVGQLAVQLPTSPELPLLVGEYNVEVMSAEDEDVEAWALVVAKLGDPEGPARVDLVHHLVSLDGLDAATAPDDPDFTAMRGELRDWLARAGIEVREETFEDVAAPELAVIDSIYQYDSELGLLLSRAPDGRAIHYFWVEEIRDDEDDYPMLGYSGGIPGLAGLGGTRASAVAVAVMDLAADPAAVGKTAFHEGLHFMGLFHSSEQCAVEEDYCSSGHDPLGDTPECAPDRDFNDDNELDFTECQRFDGDNVMFWQDATHSPVLSDDQVFVARRSPFTY